MSIEKHYLYDLGCELVRLAQNAVSKTESNDDGFQQGRQMALYEVLDLMKQQAAAFGLSDEEIGLGDFNIESLLK